MRKGNRKSIFTALLSSPLGVEPEPEPTIQASNVTIDNITATTFRINCTAGDGDGRLYVVRVGEAVNSEPVNGVTYTPNATFGDGDELPILGNYVVGNGDVETITVTHDGTRARYDVQVFERNGTTFNITNAPVASIVDAQLLSSLRLYWLPDSIAQADGSEIVQYTDLKSNVYDPASSSRRPTLETNVINGHSVIDFANGDNFRGTKAAHDFLHSGNHTLILIFKNDLDNATLNFYDDGGASNTNIGFCIQYRSPGAVRVQIANGSGTFLIQTTSSSNLLPAGSFHLVVSRFENTVGHIIEIDNLPGGSSTQTGNPSATTATSLPCFASNAASTVFNPGDVAYLAAFNAAITDEALNELIGGLDFS